jgi:hypothetical protein
MMRMSFWRIDTPRYIRGVLPGSAADERINVPAVKSRQLIDFIDGGHVGTRTRVNGFAVR